MAIREKVVLVDDYSAKARRIEASTSAMGRAMSAIRGSASSMAQALGSAFNRSYKVDIKDVGSKYLEGRVAGLKRSLDGLNKPYKVEITSKTSHLDNIKANLANIKNSALSIKKPFENAFSSVKNFKMNMAGFMAAKREARQISREISAFTGKRHRVRIDMENPMKSAFKGGFSGLFGGLKSGFSKIGSFFAKLNPFKKFGGGGGGPPVGGGEGFSLKSFVIGNLITKGITAAFSGLKTMVSTSLGAGFERLQNIESAKARLRGFGYDNKQVGQITKSATAAVTGTQYSMGDAMTASAGAIAAGIKPGELEGYLKEVGNAAAATGSDFNDVASIMNKVKTTGHLQADEMRQLSDRGLPVLAKLAEQAGVSADEMQDRISKGLVSFDQFRKAVKAASGNASGEMAKTYEGAKMNFKSALAKLGAGILGGKQREDGSQGGIYGMLTPALLKVNQVLNSLVPTFENVGDSIKDFVSNGFEKGKKALTKTKDFFKPLTDKVASKINPDSIKGLVGGGLEKAKSGLSAAKDFVAPIMVKARDGLVGAFDKLVQVFGPVKDKLTNAFNTLVEAFAPVMDALSGMFGEGVGANFDVLGGVIDLVAGAFSLLADVIVALQPVWELLASFLTGVVIPAFTALATWIGDTLVPKIVELATIVGGWVKDAFTFIGDAVNAAKSAFDNLVGAVASAADALAGLPGKIGEWVSEKAGSVLEWAKSKVGMHATGTQYFSGGLTRINERGEEMIQLARGDKIYPAGKTDRIIRNEVKSTSSSASPSDSGRAPIVININGANMTNKDVGRVISNELRRLGVVI